MRKINCCEFDPRAIEKVIYTFIERKYAVTVELHALDKVNVINFIYLQI